MTETIFHDDDNDKEDDGSTEEQSVCPTSSAELLTQNTHSDIDAMTYWGVSFFYWEVTNGISLRNPNSSETLKESMSALLHMGVLTGIVHTIAVMCYFNDVHN